MPNELVGRDGELAVIASFLDEPRGMLLLEGEAGIGKTSLWLCAAAEARERGFRVLTSRPAEAEAQLSFSGLVDLLAGAAGDVLSELPAQRRRALESALLLGDELPTRPPDQCAVALSVLGAFRLLADETPLLVAVDDLQWLDAASGAALEYAARRLAGEAVGLLVTRRLDAGADARTQALELALGAGRFERIEVGPLSLGALHQLLRLRLGASFSRPTLLRIERATRGNPFFALELGRALLATGAEPAPGEPLPVQGTLRELLRARLRGLPTSTQRALAAAAAASQPTLAVVAAATHSDRATLEPAIEAEVIELDGERIRFRHPLLTSVLYTDLPQGQRRELHRRLARLVQDPEEAAHHLALGSPRPDARIAQALEQQAARAAARGAPETAAELFERAYRLTPGTHGGDGRRRCLAAADRHFDLGDRQRARDLLHEALAAAPSGAPRAHVLADLGRLEMETGNMAAAVPLYREAMALSGTDVRLKARVHQKLARLESLLGRMASASNHARTAAELAAAAGDTRLEAQSLATLGHVEFRRGHGIQPALMEQAIELERRCGGVWIDESPTTLYAAQLVAVGNFERARTLLQALRARAVESLDASLYIPLGYLATLELRAGAWKLAERYAAEAYALATQSGRHPGVVYSLYQQAQIEALLGRSDPARAKVAELLALCDRWPHPLWTAYGRAVLGFLELSLGRPAQAYEHLGPSAAAVQALGVAEPTVLWFLPDAVESLVRLGRLDEAESLLVPLEKRGRALDRPWALGTAGRCRGLLLAERGELRAALEIIQQALGQLEHLQMPFERGRTLLALGTVQRRGKQRRAARASLGQALTTFEQLGAPLWAEKTRQELGRIGGRAPSGHELTAAEQRVAALVAEGCSNKEVAGALFVTVHTVEGALTRIYRKLEVRSRSELVRRLAEESRERAPTRL